MVKSFIYCILVRMSQKCFKFSLFKAQQGVTQGVECGGGVDRERERKEVKGKG